MTAAYIAVPLSIFVVVLIIINANRNDRNNN